MPKANKPANSSSTMVVRLVVFGILGVLVVLAILDFRAKGQATATADAIQKRMEGDVLKSEIQPLIQGSPAVSSIDPKAVPELKIATTAEQYLWKGILRNYTVLLGYGLGDDPPVEIVISPGAKP